MKECIFEHIFGHPYNKLLFYQFIPDHKCPQTIAFQGNLSAPCQCDGVASGFTVEITLWHHCNTCLFILPLPPTTHTFC